MGVGLFEKKGEHTLVDEHGLVDVVRDQAPEEIVRLLAEVESLEDAQAVHAEFLRRNAADLLRDEWTRVLRLRRLGLYNHQLRVLPVECPQKPCGSQKG